jgi:hypothetical protein
MNMRRALLYILTSDTCGGVDVNFLFYVRFIQNPELSLEQVNKPENTPLSLYNGETQHVFNRSQLIT